MANRFVQYIFWFDFSQVMLVAHATEINDNAEQLYICIYMNRCSISSDKSDKPVCTGFRGENSAKGMYVIRANIWHDKRQAPTTKNIEAVKQNQN